MLKWFLGQMKKISVFRATGLKILGRVGSHIFLNYSYSEKKNDIILCILKGISPFKMYKNIFFPQKTRFFLGFTSKYR